MSCRLGSPRLLPLERLRRRYEAPERARLVRRLGEWSCDFGMWWPRGASVRRRLIAVIGEIVWVTARAMCTYCDQWMVVLSWVMIMRPIVPPTSQPGTNEIHVPACGVPG